jgi:CBS domain-containing protein
MGKPVRDVMTPNPIRLPPDASVSEAAKMMRDAGVGAIVVEGGGSIHGLLTDRDIAIRVIAEDHDPAQTPVEKVCSKALTTLSPNDDSDHAVKLMRAKAIRRIPIVENGHTVGILSLGDLAQQRDPTSALGGISSAPPNQ